MSVTQLELADDHTPLEDVIAPLFIDYAMSVIADRALPDVRDGLKPVHRRILWSMLNDGYRPDRSHVKCAKVVGACMGNFHPHGDTALYGALVRLAQRFSLSVPLIDPHGNFGSPSDEPAAMRYTECRLSPAAMAMLEGIDENTVDHVPNFDASTTEPVVLPARFPNLLVNGLEGIAVGMATKIPPHNLDEVCRAAQALIKNPDATTRQLLRSVKGPDFPTGGTIMASGDMADLYETGRGSVRLRGVATVEGGASKPQIVVTEIPYQTSVDEIAAKAVKAVEAGQIQGVRDIRNESAEGKTRLVFDLKAGTDPDIVLNQLYKKTPLQLSYACNFVALVDGVPRTLGLRDILGHWVAHQEEVITRRTQFRLDKAEARLHIVDGLLKAIDAIDAIIALIRASENRAEARTGLMGDGFGFSEIQATHILDMPLGRLTKLGKLDLTEERTGLLTDIEEYQRILGSHEVLRSVIADELAAFQKEHKGERRTSLSDDSGDIEIAETVVDEPLVVTVTARGYLSAAPTNGRGRKVADPGDTDTVVDVWDCSSLGSIVLFTDLGKAYKANGRDLPERKLTAAQNLFDFTPGEKVVATFASTHPTDAQVATVTASGLVKRMLLADFTSAAGRRDGLAAVKMDDGDRLVAVYGVDDGGEVFVLTAAGQAIRFRVDDTRVMGRNAAGSKAIGLASDDRVVGAVYVPEGADEETMLLLASTTGWAKRIRAAEFPVQGRGGKGIRALKVTARIGSLVGTIAVDRSSTVLFLDGAGVAVTVAATEVPIRDRDSSGSSVKDVAGVAAILVAPSHPALADDA